MASANQPPVVSGPVDLGNMLEDGSILITADDLLANASDPDGDPLSVSAIWPDSGNLSDNGNGTWTFQPDPDMNGAVNFNYIISDEIGSTSGVMTSASLDITAVNDEPVVSGPVDLGTMLEDGSILITADDLLANASDPDGDPLSVSAIWSDSGNLSDNGNGTWTFQPDPDMNGAVNFNYIISDQIGSTSGVMTSASLDINAVNDAPVVSGPVDLGTMLEDGSILITANDLLANASDPDGDPLSVSAIWSDSGNLLDNGNGTWTFQPEENMNGAVNFNYFVTDNIESSYGSAGAATSASLDVTAVNDAPVVSGPVDLGTMLEDGSILITSGDLLANASDVDGDPLSVYNLTTDSGTLIDHANGTWTYYPEANRNGAVNFNYFVTDNIGSSYGSSGAATSASLDVTAVNDAPVVSGPVDLGTMLEDGSILITSDDLLANASDVDGDPLSVYNLTTDSGTLIDHANGTWTYHPEANMNGAVNFNYFVTDNIGSSYGSSGAATSASLDVTAVNDAPVVSGPVDLGTMLEDGSILITANDLLANASDVDGDP
ncbi:MAG: cadherin-like domain-containing protein, partial [Desulfobacter sp.]